MLRKQATAHRRRIDFKPVPLLRPILANRTYATMSAFAIIFARLRGHRRSTKLAHFVLVRPRSMVILQSAVAVSCLHSAFTVGTCLCREKCMKIHPPIVLGSVRFPIACSRTRLLTSVVVGLLASAANEGRAANTVFLNFDSGGANSFLSKINTAAGGAYFPAADVPAIETGIQNEINRVYGAFDVTTTTAPAAGANRNLCRCADPGCLWTGAI